MRSDSTEPVRAGRPPGGGAPARRPWLAPEVRELPRLSELTLQTGDPIPGGGGTGGGGSSVF